MFAVWLVRAPSIALVALIHTGVAAAQATPALAREPPRSASGTSALRPWIDPRSGTTGLAYHSAF